MAETSDAALLKTSLHAAHVALGAKMVPFAGYDMPVQYPSGVMAEHLWTRENAGLFDVSHMGQASLVAEDGRFETAAAALEALVPADILGLQRGQQRYTQLLSDDGGILDDLMATRGLERRENPVDLVVNAGRKEHDYRYIEERLPAGVRLERLDQMALLALQGPEAAQILSELSLDLDYEISHDLFMFHEAAILGEAFVDVSRSGYTGEDGFEISVHSFDVEALWNLLIADPRVKPIGLGARDSLRLEAGLCLHGHDIDETTSPIEAGLAWSIPKRRRDEGGFPGAARILRELREGPRRRRVGIRPEGRQPAREGCEILVEGRPIGTITSGGFGPSVNGPVAMGYVETPFAAPGTAVTLMVRGKPLPASIVPLPFVPNRFVRTPKS